MDDKISIFNLKQKCQESKNNEFYYGAKLNKDIVDVYLGMGFLEPNESGKKIGPSRNHEEIFYLTEGEIKVETKKNELIMREGDIYYMKEGLKLRISNLTDKRIYYIIAGGHSKLHKH